MRTLKEIAADIETQDNRSTASPILFLLQVKRYHYSSNCDHFSEAVYQLKGDDDYNIYTTITELREAFKNDFPDEDFKAKSYRTLYREHYWETQNVFFTEVGFNEHVKMNKHNLGEFRSFVIHTFRNPELKTVLEAILAAQ